MENPKQPVRYLLYVRKSQDAEDRQMASLDDQEEVMLRLAKERNLQVVDTIKEAKTAKQPGRIGFNELIARISRGEAEGILCWKLNRLARNPVDGGQISWLLQQGTIKHIQTFASDYKPEDNVLMMQVEFGIANQFIKNLSTDVKRGMAQKARRGWSPQRTVPVGYLHKTGYFKGDDEIVCDPKRFPIVSHLWKLVLTGTYSISEIKQMADSAGLSNNNGKPYSISSFYRIFSNPFYYGEFTWADEHGQKRSFQGKHIPIITKREFMKIQVILGRRGRPIRHLKYTFQFRDLFTCGECGCSITAEHKVKTICKGCGRKFSLRTSTQCPDCALDVSEMDKPTITDRIYYRCTKRKGVCTQKYLGEEKVEHQIHALLSEIDLPKKLVDLFLKVLNQEADSMKEDKKDLLSDLESNKEKLVEKLDKLLEMRIDGEITKNLFGKKKSSIETQISKIDERLQEVSSGQISWIEAVEKDVVLGKEILDSYIKADEAGKKAIIKAIGSNPTLSGQKLCFSIPEVLLRLKTVASTHKDEIERFEPTEAVIFQGESEENLPLIRVLRGVVQMVRTQRSP